MEQASIQSKLGEREGKIAGKICSLQIELNSIRAVRYQSEREQRLQRSKRNKALVESLSVSGALVEFASDPSLSGDFIAVYLGENDDFFKAQFEDAKDLRNHLVHEVKKFQELNDENLKKLAVIKSLVEQVGG